MRSDVGSTFLLLSCGSPLSCRSRSQPSFVVHRSPLVSLIVGSPHGQLPCRLLCVSLLSCSSIDPSSNCQLRTILTPGIRIRGGHKIPASIAAGLLKTEGERGDAAVCVSCILLIAYSIILLLIYVSVSVSAIHTTRKARLKLRNTASTHAPGAGAPSAPVQHSPLGINRESGPMTSGPHWNSAWPFYTATLQDKHRRSFQREL